ncbi:hypothetical protein D3C76_895800 [compost metagenome]
MYGDCTVDVWSTVPLALVWEKRNLPLVARPAMTRVEFSALSSLTPPPQAAVWSAITAVLASWSTDALPLVFSQAMPLPRSMIARLFQAPVLVSPGAPSIRRMSPVAEMNRLPSHSRIGAVMCTEPLSLVGSMPST